MVAPGIAGSTSAPPTERRSVESRPPRSRLPVVALVVALLGVVLPLIGFVSAILGAAALRRRGKSPPLEDDRVMAIAAIALGVVGGIVSTAVAAMIAGSLAMMTQQIRAIGVQQPLLSLQQVLDAAPDGTRPDHVARRLLDGTGYAELVLVSGGLGHESLTVGSASLDAWSDSAADRESLEQALADLDLTTPWYAFGRTRIARLPRRFAEPDLVLAWVCDAETSYAGILADDGSLEMVDERTWPEVWSRDAAARARLGLPVMEMPPFE